MDANTFSYLQEAMDELWFSKNILLFKKSGTTTAPPPDLPTNLSSESLPGKSSTTKSEKSHAVYKEKKKPPVLNIVIGQPLFQLQSPARNKLRSYPSTYSLNTGSEKKIKRRRKQSEIRSYKSLSDLENYELKGFMDLGFVFQKEKLSPEMICVIPGLQRLVEDDSEGAEKRETNEEQVKRPYLSEAWLVSKPDSPLLNPRMLPNSLEGADMKKHLRFWAREVASLAQQES
ncbi:hypothetical protein J5N97_013699 [Dioscorea zingiberensis]|uniref:Uncharacterized protein n=1 Tax=Dioscorea zingiberensis TaxID=325984 RepID=A0A9D5HIV5_9LILI|nr:hypothetical protein J5N97_013699 [Dioscorea zingiberensis]